MSIVKPAAVPATDRYLNNKAPVQIAQAQSQPVQDIFSLINVENPAPATGVQVQYQNNAKIVLQSGASNQNIFSISTQGLIDIIIYIENASSLPAETAIALASQPHVALNVKSWMNDSTTSTFYMTGSNYIYSGTDVPLYTITASNTFSTAVNLYISYTVKSFDPEASATTSNVQQVIGTVNVLSIQNSASTVTGSITSSASTVMAANLSNYPTCLVTIHGTYSGVTLKFQLSDDGGTTYYNCNAYELNRGAPASQWAFASNLSDAFYVPVVGATNLMISVTAWSSGTANIRITPISTAVSEYINTGQATMQYSSPVVIASDQTPIPVSGLSGELDVNLNQINGSSPVEVINLGLQTTPTSISTVDAQYSSVYAAQVSVGITPTQLTNQSGGDVVLLSDNNNTVPVYIGGASVSTASGFPLTPGSSISLTITNLDIVYCIAQITGQVLDVIYGIS